MTLFTHVLEAWAAVPTILEYGSVAASAYSAVQNYSAGQQAKQQAQVEAQQEASAATGRELERRQALVRSLSLLNAQAGTGGVTSDGSIGAIARRDLADNHQDLLTDQANTKARQRAILNGGNAAATAGTAKAFTSLLDSGISSYKNFSTPNSFPGG